MLSDVQIQPDILEKDNTSHLKKHDKYLNKK